MDLRRGVLPCVEPVIILQSYGRFCLVCLMLAMNTLVKAVFLVLFLTYTVHAFQNSVQRSKPMQIRMALKDYKQELSETAKLLTAPGNLSS